MRCRDCRFFVEFPMQKNGGGTCEIELPPQIENLLRIEYDDKTTFDDSRCDLGQPKQGESK